MSLPGMPTPQPSPEPRDMFVELGKITLPAARGACPNCSAPYFSMEQAEVLSLRNGDPLKGTCPNCGQRLQLKTQRIKLAKGNGNGR